MIDTILSSPIFQIFLAAFLGMVIGFEREISDKPAGLRTYALVSLGSALFTILSTTGFHQFGEIRGYDPSRIASQVVVGIGFLGAGIIFFTKDNKIRGLTTAAAVWVSAAIGMAVGLNFYILAIFATVFTVLILWLLRVIEDRVGIRK